MKEDALTCRRGILRDATIPLPFPIPPSVMGWMFAQEVAWIAGAAYGRKLLGVEGQCLEVGSYEGLSTCALAQSGPVVCVDTWRGGTDRMPDADSFPTFQANLEAVGLWSNVTPIRGSSNDVLPRLAAEGRKFRLILIDADHSYEATKADIANAWPLLSPGGMLIVDDLFVDEKRGIGFLGVKRACDEAGGFTLVGFGKIGFKIKENV